jgi:hypothetical protein
MLKLVIALALACTVSAIKAKSGAEL